MTTCNYTVTSYNKFAPDWDDINRDIRTNCKMNMPHIGSKHRYTFYLVTIGGLVTRWTVS